MTTVAKRVLARYVGRKDGRKLYAMNCAPDDDCSSSSSSSSWRGRRRKCRWVGTDRGRKVYAHADCKGCFEGGKRYFVRWLGRDQGRKVYGLACCGACTVFVRAIVTPTDDILKPTLCLDHFGCGGREIKADHKCKYFGDDLTYQDFYDIRAAREDEEPDRFRICMTASDPITPLAFEILNANASIPICVWDANGPHQVGPGLIHVTITEDLLDIYEDDSGALDLLCGDIKIRCGCCGSSSSSSRSSRSRSSRSRSSASSSSSSFGPPACPPSPCHVFVSITAAGSDANLMPRVGVRQKRGGNVVESCCAEFRCEQFFLLSTGDTIELCAENGNNVAAFLLNPGCAQMCVDGHTLAPGMEYVVPTPIPDCTPSPNCWGNPKVLSVTCAPC